MTAWHATRPGLLSESDWNRWEQIHGARPDVDSPFFHPELTRLTATVRRDVEVAALSDRGIPVGFFPFQRDAHDRAQPVTGRLSEFHGAVTAASREWSPDDLLAGCGLASWHFDHLPTSQTGFADFIWGETTSPYLGLDGGFDECRATLRRSGSTLSQVERKARKIAREVGPLRFEFHTRDADAFAALVDWKTAQHRQTGVLQVLRRPWVVNLFEAVRQADGESFGGPLSALYAGDHLVAVHLGLRSARALHIWFPAYNVEFERFSPGLVLLLRLAEACAARGLSRIDFGRGEERYKANFKTGDIRIAEGSVSREYLRVRLHATWYHANRRIRQSRWRRQLEVPLLATRRFRQAMAFR